MNNTDERDFENQCCNLLNIDIKCVDSFNDNNEIRCETKTKFDMLYKNNYLYCARRSRNKIPSADIF